MMRLLQKKQENPFKYKIQMRSASERAERNKGLSLSGKIDSIFFVKKLLLGFLEKIKTRNIKYFVSNIKIVKQNTIKKNKKYVQHSGTEPEHRSTIALTNELRGL